MRTLYCLKCASPDVEYIADITVGCCSHKSGELWKCSSCGEEIIIQVVYSDDDISHECPHESEEGCDSKSVKCEHKK